MSIIKAIPNYVGYFAHPDGYIIGKKGPMHPKVLREGYLRVTLNIDKNKYTECIHTLIALTFKGIRPPGMEINHIDGNKLNNAASNLEYVTPKENIKHSFDMNLQPMGINRGLGRYSDEEIENVRKLHFIGNSYREISLSTGISKTQVARIITNKQRKVPCNA